MNRVNIEEGSPKEKPKVSHRANFDRRDSVQSGEKAARAAKGSKDNSPKKNEVKSI